ncbi:D-tagatose-bisphosphate aldolase, class II, non-catalytic subunit [Halomonas sp. 86]|uniref:D-tagatose-bisphosphate aldolase, class II, non-catalytic subunit n=1 Tax=unclassified Halomonas TaxID=2609666 RepID=UPI00403329CE
MNAPMIRHIADWHKQEGPSGIPSVCSAHPLVLEAAMKATLPTRLPLLIEATCNQVNQDGGYTGMTPKDFRTLVENIAVSANFPLNRIILGGDHLGPNPWKALGAEAAMDKAESMIRAYAAAGFTKLHLDCSMGCAGEPVALDDAKTAERAARLAGAAEQAALGQSQSPVYVIGTEVPIPGGALEAIEDLEVTSPNAIRETVKIHQRAFQQAGLTEAFGRIIAAVVQPGVEFGNHNVVIYDPVKARDLSTTLSELPGIVFEAHSTDYQPPSALSNLVADGFAILKVGPGLTFALRETLYGLDMIADELYPDSTRQSLRNAMEAVMQAEPANWQKYYEGTNDEQAMLRHFSYSDRIRYYWPAANAKSAVHTLLELFDEIDIPEPLISQYLGGLLKKVRNKDVAPRASELIFAAIEDVMQDYILACKG